MANEGTDGEGAGKAPPAAEVEEYVSPYVRMQNLMKASMNAKPKPAERARAANAAAAAARGGAPPCSTRGLDESGKPSEHELGI